MLSKLTLQNVIVIGVVVAVVIATGIFFVLIRPTQAEIKNLDTQIEAASQRAAQLPTAKRQLEDAKKEVEEARLKWARYERSKMPTIDLTDRLKGALAYWKEPERTAKLLQDWVSKSSQDVIFFGGFAIGVPTTDPNQLPWPIWVVPLGTFQVQGDFESILRHVERWNNAPRLVLVDGLQLSGVSPQLIGQYTATLFILPRAKDDRPAEMLPSAGGAGGMAGFGGMGRFGGGMPGAPMMGGPMMGAPTMGAPMMGAPSMPPGMPPMGVGAPTSGARPPMGVGGGAGVGGPALGGGGAPGVEDY